MGWGDDLMATGVAKFLADSLGGPVHFGYDSEIFLGNPNISKDGTYIPNNNPGHPRPYVLGSLGDRLIWNPNHRALPGEVYLRDEEKREPGDYWIIEPNVKGTYSQNKDWGFDKWQEVVDNTDLNYVQFNGPYLNGVTQITTNSFRAAMGWVEAGRGYIGPEGGLHHASAAFRKPAVVLFGPYIHPSTTGYGWHTNMGGGWCGRRKPCEHCRQELDKITVEQVVEAVREISHEEVQAAGGSHLQEYTHPRG